MIVLSWVTSFPTENERSGVRWAELRRVGGAGNPWTVFQDGLHSPDNVNSRFMSSIAMDGSGNIALGYSISSSTTFPGIRYVGREASDPLSTMTIGEQTIFNGLGSQPSNRYGDNSAMSVDPIDECTFWYTNEYIDTDGAWDTRDRQERTRQSCQEKVDKIQEQYDHDRAKAVAEYVHERCAMVQCQSEEISLGDGAAVCSACSSSFHPQRRDDLAGWQRCSISGCTSGTIMCVECSSIPCSRCCAPVCTTHRLFHDTVCRSECQRVCGYDEDDDIVLWGGVDSCCGNQVDLVEECYGCNINVCRHCLYCHESDRPENDWPRFYCPECSTAYDSAVPLAGFRVPKATCWTGSEYERERDRRDETGTAFDRYLAPVESVNAASERSIYRSHAKQSNKV